MPIPLIAAALGGVLIESLPSISSWIFGDKTGKAVETVTSIARDVLGTDNPADIERALAADPHIALEFKKAVLLAEADARAHTQEMSRLSIEEVKQQLADIASARAQTVELAKAGSSIAWGAPLISILITSGFFIMLYVVLRSEIPDGSRDIANIMLGSLGTSFTAVVAYWVGSSAGSAQKTIALEKAAANGGR